MAFMPFITAGDPDVSATAATIQELGRCGVDLIEVGFPYSDPIADGPVIQASYTRALSRGLRVEDIFAAIEPLTDTPPLVAMVSYALVYRIGVDQFLQRAAQAGFSGLIVPDLPGDEAEEMAARTSAHGLDLVQLIAPTSTPERTARILRSCSGFVYCIAVSGTTGERNALPTELADHLRSLREQTSLPLAVGFGISGPAQVDGLRGLADGVIVGSSIVRRMEAGDDGLAEVADFARSMVSAVNP